MRKLIFIFAFILALSSLAGCMASEKEDNIITEPENTYFETLDAAKEDLVLSIPVQKIEADKVTGNSLIDNENNPSGIPAAGLESILPSVKKGFTLPDVVKGPLATKNSNGVSEYLSSMSISTNKIILNQSSGRKLKADTSKLNSLIKNYSYDTSILAIRISDGSYIAYNIDKSYSCASTIKAPYSMYVYSLAADNQISLNEKIKYQSYHYIGGSGVIKNKGVGTSYTTRELVKYSMINSDNIAHTMLADRYGKGVNRLFEESGSRITLTNTDWPLINARDVAIWWNEILEFRDTGAIGKEFFDITLDVGSPIIYSALGRKDIPFAHKSGWVKNVCHEAGIIMTDDPYILVVLTTKPLNSADTYTNHIVNVVREINNIMENK